MLYNMCFLISILNKIHLFTHVYHAQSYIYSVDNTHIHVHISAWIVRISSSNTISYVTHTLYDSPINTLFKSILVMAYLVHLRRPIITYTFFSYISLDSFTIPRPLHKISLQSFRVIMVTDRQKYKQTNQLYQNINSLMKIINTIWYTI